MAKGSGLACRCHDRLSLVPARLRRLLGQRALGYGWRALVEANISRWKRVIGEGLRSQTDGRQASEVAIATDVLNRMLELGRPEYVRIATLLHGSGGNPAESGTYGD